MHRLLSSLLLLGIGVGSVSVGSANDAVVNAILDGVTITGIPDTEIPGYGGARDINVSRIAVDGLHAEISNVTSTSGIVAILGSAVNVSAELIVFFFGSAYGMKVDAYVHNFSLVANLSNPEGIVEADATQVDVLGLDLVLTHTCVEGLLCELIMAVGYGYLTEMEWIHEYIEDLVTPLLGNLSLAITENPHPEPKVVAVEEEKTITQVPELFQLGSSWVAKSLSQIVNEAYGAPQEDGNTELGKLLKDLYPRLDIVLNTTFPVFSGNEYFIMGTLALGLDTVSVTDAVVPSVAVEFIGDYSMELTVTVSRIKGRVTGSLIMENKPNGNADYAGAMVADIKDGAIRFNLSVMVGANETEYATLPLASLLDSLLGSVMVGSDDTTEELVAQLVRSAMPLADGSDSWLVPLLEELLMGSPEIGKLVNCWLLHPLMSLKVSTLSMEILTLELEQFTVDGDEVGLIPVVVDFARLFLMDGVNYLLRPLIDDLRIEVNTALEYMTNTSGQNPCSITYTPAPEPVTEFNYTSSKNDAVVNAVLDGAAIPIADVEIAGVGGAQQIIASGVSVDGVHAEIWDVTGNSGMVALSAGSVNVSAGLVLVLPGATSGFAIKVDVFVDRISLVGELSRPEEGNVKAAAGTPEDRVMKADATKLVVQGLDFALSHKCVEGDMCGLIMAVVNAYVADKQWLNDFISDLITPLLVDLSLAAAETPYPEPKVVAVEEEKVFAQVPDLFKLGSSWLGDAVLLIANRVYGVRQEDGNTALGQMLKHFFPKLDIVLNTTFPVFSGNEYFTMGNLSLGLDTVSLTDATVPTLAVEFIEDYSLTLTVTLREVKGKVTGSLIMEDKPNGSADYAGAMVADIKDGAIRLNLSIMVAANETQYATLPLGSLFYPNLGGGQTAEELLAQLVRSAMPLADGDESAGFITRFVQELLTGNPEIASIVNCWLQYPLVALKVSTLSVELLTLELERFTVDEEEVGLVPAIVDLAREFLLDGVNYLLRSLIDDVQSEVNTLLQHMTYTSGENPCSTSYTMPEGVDGFNYLGNSVMEVLDSLVNTYIGTEGSWSINAYLDAIAELDFDAGWYYSYDAKFEIGELALELSNFNIAKVKSQEWFDSMALLKAKTATVLGNELDLGGLGLTMDVAFSFLTEATTEPFSNKMQVTVSLQSLTALIDLLAEFSLPRLMLTPVGHMLSLSTGCLLGSLEQLRLPKAEFEMKQVLSSFLLDVQCINCLTPGFKQLHQTMTTPEGIGAMYGLMQYVLTMVEGVVNSDVLTRWIDYEVSAAQLECTIVHDEAAGASAVVSGAAGASPARVWTTTETAVPAPASYQADDNDGPMTNTKALVIIYSITGAILLAFTVHAVWALAGWDSKNAKTEDLPLILHPSISVWVRWGVPLFIAGTVVVFLTSNLLFGAGVSGMVLVGGTELPLENLFSYELGTTVRDMWNAEVYYLAIIIAVFSGIWPYAKLFALVWGWVVPPSALNRKRRGHLFLILDYTGKWSLLDTMMMIMLMVSFRMHFVLPAAAFLPAKFFSFDLVVEPGWGVHGFMTGAIMSLAVNHLMVMTHRNAQEYDETKGVSSSWFDEVDVARASERVVLATHGWAGATAHQSKVRTGGVIVLLVVSLILLVLGATIKTFEFEFDGVAAFLLNASDPGSHKESFSLLELASDVTKQHDVQDGDFGLWYIAVTFVLFTFVTPLVQTLGLIALWIVPLTLKEQKYFLFFNEIIAAWCAPEVFIFVLVSTLVQIEQFSEYMVVEQCAYFDFLMEAYIQPMGFLQEYKPTCFRTEANLLAGCWISFAAALISIATYVISWYAAAGVIQHRHSLHEQNTGGNEPIQDVEDTEEPVDPVSNEVLDLPKEAAPTPPEEKAEE
ncbi:hypothetical protein DIPPA_31162 [Diplonema papillatum]|nr:hypothetical protein DIPPA_31177 [Diplonema papillatum]KAJ9451729.1 hypothetical protein DIPPA_31162 [Diplonema papillatum]